MHDRRASVEVKMKWQMPMHATKYKREHAKHKTYGKADEIKIGPRHSDRLPSLPLEPFVAFGSNASSKRSVRPGVFRIAPINRKQRRVSLSRAALSSTSLTSGSLAKRSAPCSSQTSSFPSVVRKSETSSVW